MSNSRKILKGSTVLLVALATGCANAPATSPAAGAANISGAGLISNNASGLISNNAGGLISNNAGGLISNNAGGLISNNAGGLISNNAGGLISNNAGGLISNNAGGLISNNAGGLTGAVRGPAAGLISNNAGGLISNNAGGLISNNAGGLISNNAGGLISNNAGGLISNNAGGFHVLQAAADDDLTEPVANAKVACFNERGEMVSRSWQVTSDGSDGNAVGSYSFAPGTLKASGPVIFVKAVYQREGKQVVLVSTAPAPRKPGVINCTVSPATSIVAKKLGEMIQRRAVSASSVRAESIDKITQTLAPAMTPKAVVAAAILQQSDASIIFDAMVKESPALAAKVNAEVASEGIANVVAATPPDNGGAAPAAAAAAAPDSAPVTGGPAAPAAPAADPGTPAAGNNGSTPAQGGVTQGGAGTTPPAQPAAPAGNPALKGTVFTLGTVSSTPRVDMPKGSSAFTAALRTGVTGGAFGSLTSAMTFTEDAGNAATSVAFDGTTPYYLVGNSIVGNGKTVTMTGLSDTDGSDLAVSGNTAYVASMAQNCIYKVDLAAGTTSVFAGISTNLGTFADGAAGDARFNSPAGVCIVGNTLYVADTYNRRIRAVAADGSVSTLAGSGIGSQDGTGVGASFQGPTDVTSDDKGNLYVADQNGNTVRKVVAADGTTTTIAGNGKQGTVDGAGSTASLFFPTSIAWGKAGGADILVVGQINHKIRVVSGW